MKDFNVQKETENIIKFIKDYYEKNNLGGAILGISGGKDSAVVSGLMVKSIGKENVLGVWMPCHSKEEDKNDAKLVSEHFGFRLIDFDLTDTYENFKATLADLGSYTEEETKNSDINVKPRIRMATLYYLAALESKLKGKTYLVVGTSNKDELYLGYFTKGGDSVCDIAIIADFHVDEVIKIGEYINVPKKVLYKTPDDGISNESDEQKLGVTYSDTKKYINGEEVSTDEAKQRIKKLHESNLHKFNIPTYTRNNNN